MADDMDVTSSGNLGASASTLPGVPIIHVFIIISLAPIVMRLLTTLVPRVFLRRNLKSTGAAPAPLVNLCPRTHYGLAVGEAGDVSHDESDSDDEGITARELRRLERSSAFQAWCAARGLSLPNLEDTSSRLNIYRRLRTLHPDSFWLLCRADTRFGFVSIDPGWSVLLLEYVISITVFAAIGLSGYCSLACVHPFHWIGCAAVVWILCLRYWVNGRPSAGPIFDAWYAELEWGHRASAVRCVTASLLEGMYVVGTLGLGAAVSLYMRCCSTSRQSVGERIAGVKLVVERRVSVN